MRQHGDVIAFDQRGTGSSTDLPGCQSGQVVPYSRTVAAEELADLYRSAVIECREFWRAEGIAIDGYNTAESVADLSALRGHLGAERLDLWGISYGSHLALAALDRIPDEIDQVIIASAEGLDQTVKLPARTNAYFERLQAAIETQPETHARVGDVPAMMRRVQARLADTPIQMEVKDVNGETVSIPFGRRHLQIMTSYLIADPDNVSFLLAIYQTLDQGEPGLAQQVAPRFFDVGEPISLRAMSTAMDRASGISPARKALWDAQVAEGLTGPYLNFPMPQISSVWPEIDLGDDFRDGPYGDTPVLLLTGTLDGRTYVEGQVEAVAGLTDVTQVMIVNAGHNLFMARSAVGEAMHAFMRGEPVPDEIVVALPTFSSE